MSTFWTPSGERPIPRDEPAAAPPPPPGPERPPERGTGPSGGDEMDDEALQAELRAMQEQMLRTPAAIVVANHCIGLIELAVIELDDTEVVIRPRQPGVEPECFEKRLPTLFGPPPLEEDHAEIQVGRGKIRLQGEGFLQVLFGLVQVLNL